LECATDLYVTEHIHETAEFRPMLSRLRAYVNFRAVRTSRRKAHNLTSPLPLHSQMQNAVPRQHHQGLGLELAIES